MPVKVCNGPFIKQELPSLSLERDVYMLEPTRYKVSHVLLKKYKTTPEILRRKITILCY